MGALNKADLTDTLPTIEMLAAIRGELRKRFEITGYVQGTGSRIEAASHYADAITFEVECRQEGDEPLAFDKIDEAEISEDLACMTRFLSGQFELARAHDKAKVGGALLSAAKATKRFSNFTK